MSPVYSVYHVAGLDARSHLVALMAGQLIEAHGLRDIEAVLAAHAPALKRRRIEPACRSTLADANKARSPAAFEAVIPALLTQLSPTEVRRTKENLRLVDSTLVHQVAGAALGALPERQGGRQSPRGVRSEGASSDLLRADLGEHQRHHRCQIEDAIEGAYVFDLGYYDFVFWAELRQRLSFRYPSEEKYAGHRRRRAAGAGRHRHPLRQDHSLARVHGGEPQEPFAEPGRMIVVMTDTGKPLKLFTNDLDSSAEAVAGLYKTRWQIELFFRWIKQNLRIRRFHGRSENAVQLQIAAVVITYLLWKLSHTAARTKKTAAVFLTALRNALFHRIKLETLGGRIERRHASPDQVPSAQLEFAV